MLVQEVERVGRSSLDVREATAAIRKAVLDEFDITLRDVVFVLPGTLPKTSSGKVRRAEARRRYLDGALEAFSPRAPVIEQRVRLPSQ